eukprot:g69830.t1
MQVAGRGGTGRERLIAGADSSELSSEASDRLSVGLHSEPSAANSFSVSLDSDVSLDSESSLQNPSVQRPSPASPCPPFSLRPQYLVVALLVAAAGTGLVLYFRGLLRGGGADDGNGYYELPSGPLILSYAGCVTDNDFASLVQSGRNGINVFNWFSIVLFFNQSINKSYVESGSNLNFTCIARVVNELERLRDSIGPTAHLVTVGGWNAPHPDSQASVTEAWASFKEWNEQNKAQFAFGGFQGIDWDLEGNDDLSSPLNLFTVAQLDWVGQFSQLAKSEGYIVTMVPAQSYLDVDQGLWSRNLTLSPSWQPSFHYAGANSYAYWLSRYGRTEQDGVWVDTFDLVDVQLYETFSRASHLVVDDGMPAHIYLQSLVMSMALGYTLDFASDPELNYNTTGFIQVPPQKLTIGVTNYYTGQTNRNYWFTPTDLQTVYQNLQRAGIQLRAFMFFHANAEGNPGYNNTAFYLAPTLNRFMQARPYDDSCCTGTCWGPAAGGCCGDVEGFPRRDVSLLSLSRTKQLWEHVNISHRRAERRDSERPTIDRHIHVVLSYRSSSDLQSSSKPFSARSQPAFGLFCTAPARVVGETPNAYARWVEWACARSKPMHCGAAVRHQGQTKCSAHLCHRPKILRQCFWAVKNQGGQNTSLAEILRLTLIYPPFKITLGTMQHQKLGTWSSIDTYDLASECHRRHCLQLR